MNALNLKDRFLLKLSEKAFFMVEHVKQVLSTPLKRGCETV